MSEKQMTGKDIVKRTLPVAIALVLIVIIAVIVMSAKSCSNKTPTLSDGDETFIVLKGKDGVEDLTISKDRLYTYMKQQYGVSELMRLVDNKLYEEEMNNVKQEDLDAYIIENVFTSKSLDKDNDNVAIKKSNQDDFDDVIDSLLMNNLLTKADVDNDPYNTTSKVWDVLRKYYKLQYARREWAKNAYQDFLKEELKDSDDEKTYSDMFTDDDLESYFEDNYSGTVYGLFIPFTSEEAAKKAMNSVGINTSSELLDEDEGWVRSEFNYNENKEIPEDAYLTPSEVYKAFIALYNKVYVGQGKLAITAYEEEVSLAKTLTIVVNALNDVVKGHKITGDIILPTTIEVKNNDNATITWELGETSDYVKLEGGNKIIYETAAEADEEITLKATVEFKENNTKTVSYELTISKLEDIANKAAEETLSVAAVEPFMQFKADCLKNDDENVSEDQKVKYIWTTKELEAINDTLATYLKEDSTKLEISSNPDEFADSYTVKPISCGNYYFLMIKFKSSVGDNLSEVKDQVIQDKFDSLITGDDGDNYINQMIYKHRQDADLQIYDRYIEAIYDYQYTYFHETTMQLTDYDEFEYSKKKEKSAVAKFKVNGKTVTITADELYAELASKYSVSITVDLINQYKLVSDPNYNTIYNPYTGVKDKDSYSELLTSEVGNFRKNFELGYFTYSYLSYYGFTPNFPASYGWSNFKKDYFGAFSDEELLINSSFGGSAYSEALKAYKETLYTDVVDEATAEASDAYKRMQELYDAWYGLNVVNLVVGIDTNYDGTMNQQSNKYQAEGSEDYTFMTTDWTDEQKDLAQELIELFKELLPQTAQSGVYSALEELVEVYNNAGLEDETNNPTDDSTIYNYNYFAKFKRAGIVLKLEKAAEYNNSSSLVEEFLDALEEIYKEAVANGEEGTFDVPYASGAVETMYGYHLIYALNITEREELPEIKDILIYNLVEDAESYADSTVEYKIKKYEAAVKALKELGVEYTSDYEMDEEVSDQISAWYSEAVTELTGEKALTEDLIKYIEDNRSNIQLKGEFNYTDNGTEVKFDSAKFNAILDSILEVSKKDLAEELEEQNNEKN